MTIHDRVRADINRGDYALARERLASHVNAKGYDAELLAKLGEISFEMHDHFSAGKFWLTSSAEGPDVELAIQTFVSRCGHDPHQIVSQLPRFARLKSMDGYPASATSRLERLKLCGPLLKITAAGVRRPSGYPPWLFTGGCVVMALFGIASFSIGLVQIIRWVIP